MISGGGSSRSSVGRGSGPITQPIQPSTISLIPGRAPVESSTSKTPVLMLIWISLVLAMLPAYVFWRNLRILRPAPAPTGGAPRPSLSVLIPARNEEAGIGASVASVLASRGVDCEVLVLDDRSEDRTAAIVGELADRDDRVRLVRGPDLPAGWCGKQHACWVLVHEARHPLLVFLDADVRLSPDALVGMAAFLEATGAAIASGVPRQETVGFLEKLIIPLIHFILLGFLPIHRMRRNIDPRFAAGCGQLFITRREAYDRAGGHAAIRSTLHDGLKLPRVYRLAGLKTDLFDATDLAVCRMYTTVVSLWNGLAKNAGEALASPGLIVPMTAVLLGGQVLPLVLLVLALESVPVAQPWWVIALAILGVSASYYPRLAAVGRFRQSWLGALLHPLGILVLLSIQWYAFARNFAGRPATWKGRPYMASQVLDPATEQPTP